MDFCFSRSWRELASCGSGFHVAGMTWPRALSVTYFAEAAHIVAVKFIHINQQAACRRLCTILIKHLIGEFYLFALLQAPNLLYARTNIDDFTIALINKCFSYV